MHTNSPSAGSPGHGGSASKTGSADASATSPLRSSYGADSDSDSDSSSDAGLRQISNGSPSDGLVSSMSLPCTPADSTNAENVKSGAASTDVVVQVNKVSENIQRQVDERTPVEGCSDKQLSYIALATSSRS
jgi:hypothetical protein